MTNRVSEAIVSLTYILDVIEYNDHQLVQKERNKVDTLELQYFRALRYMIMQEIKRVIVELEKE